MPYLQPAEYANYGLPAATSEDWITAATALINSFCRRPDLNTIEYTERQRLTQDTQTAHLTYLPLAPLGTATSPIVSLRGRYAQPRRGEVAQEILWDAACAFALPGQWSAIDPANVDVDCATGELTLPPNPLGIRCNEIEVTYTAGLTVIGDDVKSACAQIVRNAQATPALNARSSRIDTIQMQYFSSSLLDETVRTWLRPYVASRLG